MWWKKAVLLPWVLSLPFVYSGVADDGAGGLAGERMSVVGVVFAQSDSLPLPGEGETATSEREDEDGFAKGREPQDSRASPSSEPVKKSVPPKEFVPSEKIEADNAVDFPVDI
jgi:hypothetical protein